MLALDTGRASSLPSRHCSSKAEGTLLPQASPQPAPCTAEAGSQAAGGGGSPSLLQVWGVSSDGGRPGWSSLACTEPAPCPLQTRQARRSRTPKPWSPKPRIRPPECSPGSKTCRRTWSSGRASTRACRARTWARRCWTQAAQVGPGARWPCWWAGGAGGVPGSQHPHSLSHSVHPGEDAAAAAGQAEPPAGPWGAQCQPGPVCQHRPRAGAHCSSPRRRQ